MIGHRVAPPSGPTTSLYCDQIKEPVNRVEEIKHETKLAVLVFYVLDKSIKAHVE